jgi:hypothetical protein
MHRLLLASCLLLLPGCAWLMGQDHLDQPLPPFRAVEAQSQTRLEPGVLVRATYRGVGERIVVAATPLGRIARVVNPFGEDSLVVELDVTNASTEPITVLASAAKLSGPGGERRVRSLDDYRKRWPSWAVENQEQEGDRLAAMDFVLEHLLGDRLVEPDKSLTGRLAFPLFRPGDALFLSLPLRMAGTRRNVELKWDIR